MATELHPLVRLLTATATERQHHRDLAAIERQGELADLRVRSTGHVTQHAMAQSARSISSAKKPNVWLLMAPSCTRSSPSLALRRWRTSSPA